jgi:hypothetical protein
MTVTFIDTPGETLDSANESLDFTTDRAVPAISVYFGSGRSEERVYRDGAFLWPYSGSSVSGSGPYTWSITRSGGWLPEPKLYIDESPAPVVSTLQPLNYSSNIVAAYALNITGADCNLDRSTNARNFVTAGGLASDMANVPDLIAPMGAIMGAATNGIYSGSPRYANQYGSHWKLEGELTVSFRWWLCAPSGAEVKSPVYCNADPTGTSSVAFQVAVVSGNYLTYYAERLKVGQLFTSSLVVPTNQWVFITLRRRSNGTVRLGLGTTPYAAGQTYQDSGALSLPQSSIGATNAWFCRFGYNVDASPVQPGGGPMADFVCWNRFLTDDELIPQYQAALGAYA